MIFFFLRERNKEILLDSMTRPQDCYFWVKWGKDIQRHLKKSTMSHYHGIVMFYKVNNHHVFPKITLGAIISVRVKVKWLGCSYSVLLNQVYLAPSEWCEGGGYKIISGYFLSFVELKIPLLWILHTSRGGFWLTKNFTWRSFMMWYK